uniref:JNK pathway associated phosphatase n=1 Tax=Canis lupus familiaris TaxID=9615 RepID=A0A8C0REG0_CANLF
MGNGMNKILPGLYIGNFKDARDAEQLSKNKVTHILSVHDSARPLLEHFLSAASRPSCPDSPGVKYLCIPAADSPSQNLTRHFKESIKFIHECRLRGEGCLVHCLAGVSRSVTLVIAYVMTVTDLGWEDALHTVRAGRSCANPNLGFQRQLQEFEKHEVHQVTVLRGRWWCERQLPGRCLSLSVRAQSRGGRVGEVPRAHLLPGCPTCIPVSHQRPLPHLHQVITGHRGHQRPLCASCSCMMLLDLLRAPCSLLTMSLWVGHRSWLWLALVSSGEIFVDACGKV